MTFVSICGITLDLDTSSWMVEVVGVVSVLDRNHCVRPPAALPPLAVHGAAAAAPNPESRDILNPR